MHTKILSDALFEQAVKYARFELIAEQDYNAVLLDAMAFAPDVTVVEVPESGPWSAAEKCLAICNMIRSMLPACKQMILCSESDADSCRAAVLAKQEQRIDDFLDYDTSVKYLFTKLDALTEKKCRH
jgi:response regulator RpfG family c-di-GMP phosphodiesterase